MTYQVSFTAHVPDGWDSDDVISAIEDAGLDPDPCSITPVAKPEPVAAGLDMVPEIEMEWTPAPDSKRAPRGTAYPNGGCHA